MDEKETDSEQTKKKSGVSRREFITGTVGSAAMLGASAVLVPSVTAASVTAGPRAALPQPGQGGVPINYSPNVVVAGSGLGGFTAAIAAATAGAKVVLVEVSHKTGGPARYANGGISSMGPLNYQQYATFQQQNFNAELAQAFWANFVPAYTWLYGLGAYFTMNKAPAIGGTFGRGEPNPVRNGLFLDSLERILLGAGGTILVNTKAQELLTDCTGTVAGLRVQTVDAAAGTVDPAGTYDIRASAVILSTGGFFANNELVSKYIGPNAIYGTFQGHPYNMGDGMAMAQAVGASLDGHMANGCFAPGPAYPCVNPQENRADFEARLDQQNAIPGVGIGEYWLLCWQLPPPQAIFVNWDGNRFMNEDSSNATIGYTREETYEFYQQPFGQAFCIYDDPMWQTWAPGLHTLTDQGPVSHAGSLAIYQKYGGIVLQANTLSDLADSIVALNTGKHGMNKTTLLNTITNYNAAVAAGTTAQLSVPRTGSMAQIQTAPFYAVKYSASRIYNDGGLAINAQANVLDGQKFPIAGLYATPPCANSGASRYPGGLANALTFGYIAGNAAAAYALTHKF